MLNIDADTELDMEFDTDTINYFQMDFSVNVSFDVRQYFGTEFTVYIYPEINSDANKQLLIGVEFTLDLSVSRCIIFLLQILGKRCIMRRFAHRINSVPIIYCLNGKNTFFGLKDPFKQKICPTCLSKPLPNRSNMLPLGQKSFAIRMILFYFAAKRCKYHCPYRTRRCKI